MMSFLTSVWLNIIVLIVLIASLYFLISKIQASNAKKTIFSCLAVVLIFILAGFFSYSRLSLNKKKRNFKTINTQISEVKDLSDFESDKYLINLLVPGKTQKNQLRTIIKNTTDFIKKKKPGVSIIWLTIFNKKLPAEELEAGTESPYFIAQSQWVKSTYSGFLSANFEGQENYRGIEIIWKR